MFSSGFWTAMAEFVGNIHFLQFFPCCSCLRASIGSGEERRGGKVTSTSPDLECKKSIAALYVFQLQLPEIDGWKGLRHIFNSFSASGNVARSSKTAKTTGWGCAHCSFLVNPTVDVDIMIRYFPVRDRRGLIYPILSFT